MFTRLVFRLFAAAMLAILLAGAATGAAMLVLGARSPAGPHAPLAGAPTVVSYQGKVWEGGTPYSGNGYFKFAIVDFGGTTSYWSNNGSSTGGGQPTAAVPLLVSVGLFTVMLGDTSLTNMTQPLTADVFSGTERYLRIWFSSDNVAFTQISPDQRLAAVPYALQAADSDLLDGQHGSAYQQRVSGACAVGSTIRAINADGTLVCEAHDARPAFSRTALGGLGSGGWFTAIAIGSDGLPVIAYNDQTVHSLKFLHCLDLACLSAETTTIAGGNAGWGISIAIGADGLPVIAYLVQDSAAVVAHCENLACTSKTITTLQSAFIRNGVSIAIGVDGLALISYHVDTSRSLRTAHCSNLACTSFTLATLDTGVADVTGENSSIAIGVDGLGLISYFDNETDDWLVAHCNDISCSTAAISMVDSSGGGNSGGRGITIGSDGLGIIAYHVTGGYRIAHCSNLTCSASTITTISMTPVSYTEAISIGSDGLPLIVVYDPTQGDLLAIHCSDHTCSQYSTTYLASPDTDGYFPSLAIGSDGMPVIAYVNSTDHTVEAAHCSNWLCIPYWQRP